MTFYDIFKKMLLFDLRKCQLYFLCNLSAAALFCCFAVIFTNRTFMNGQIVDPSISSNIYLPSFLTALFLILFLPLSFQAFLASRKQEYGVMFALGMSRREAFRYLLFENIVISLAALLTALAAGTILSFLFFAFIVYGIGIEGVQWHFSMEAYKITVLLYVTVMTMAFVLHAGKLMRDKIGTLLKAQYRSEKAGQFFILLCRIAPGYMNRHLLEWSFMRRHRKEWRLRYLLAVLIVTVCVLLTGSCATLYPAFLQDAKKYTPYDMMYAKINEMNQVPLENVIHILEENGTAVDQVIQIPYLRDHAFNYLPVTEVNESFGCNYQIRQGEFLNLFQYVPGDGYEHDTRPISAVTLSNDKKLHSVGSDVRILFNQNPAFADRTLIVNDSDFEKLSSDTTYSTGLMELFRFEQWENSYKGICALKEYLHNSNQVDEEEQYYYELSSKVESCRDAEKSGQFLLFLIVFVAGLMLAAEFLLIHSRIQAESEENGRAICSLQLLGMADRNILKCLQYKNFLRFLPPLITGTIFSFLPLYYFNQSYGMGIHGILAGIVFGMIITAGTAASISRYSAKESRHCGLLK